MRTTCSCCWCPERTFLQGFIYMMPQRGHSLKLVWQRWHCTYNVTTLCSTSSSTLLSSSPVPLHFFVLFLLPSLLFPPWNDTSIPPCAFLYPFFCIYKWDVGQMRALHQAAFDMEIHLPQQSEIIQLYYLTVKHAAATRPAGWKWGVFTLLGRIGGLEMSRCT